MKTKLIGGLILVALFIGYVLLEKYGPQRDQWTPKLGQSDTDPFGSKLLFESLGDLFPDVGIETVENNPASFLREFQRGTSNYIILQDAMNMSELDAEALIRYAENGNTLFISAAVFEGKFAEQLSLESDWFWNRITYGQQSEDDFLIWGDLAKDSTLQNELHYPILDNLYYFNLSYAANVDEILSTDNSGDPVYARFDVGEGSIYLHTVPLMFTNFSMVDPINQLYIARCLSELPIQKTYWDEYFKPNRSRVKSPVEFILAQPSLNWAWVLLLVTIILFIIFEGKRRQRPLPIMLPPKNDTLEFTKTVGRLYLAHGDHRDIALKKGKYFFEYVRSRYRLETRDRGETFRHKLAQKSAVPREKVDHLIENFEKVRRSEKVTEAALLELHRQIEDFYERAK